MHGLWWLLAESENTFDDPTFHGQNAEFWIDPPPPRIRHSASKLDEFEELDSRLREDDENLGPLESFQLDVPDYQIGDPTIAIANFQFARDRWAELLGKQCWKRVKNAYPSPSVLAVVVQQTFGTAKTDAVQCLMFESGDPHEVSKKAIGYLESERRQFVSLVAPTYIMFLSSLIAQGLWSHRVDQAVPIRNDEPSETEIRNGNSILDRMMKDAPAQKKPPTRDAFEAACKTFAFKISTAKATKIWNAWKKNRK